MLPETARIDRYRLGEEIRATELMTELDAVRVDTQHRVTVRLYRASLSQHATFVDHFERACVVQRRLGALVVPVDGAGRSESGVFVALERVDSPTLSSMRPERLAVRDVVELVYALCTVYAAAHQEGLWLGVDPEAIYVTRQAATVQLAAVDLFAHALHKSWWLSEWDASARIVEPRSLEYMPPEQLMNKPLDPRSDVYALGVLAYELLTGHKPFPDARGPANLILAQLKQTPPRPSELVAEAPPELDAILATCLAKDRNARFADASALAAAISPMR